VIRLMLSTEVCNPSRCDAYRLSGKRACEGCPANPENSPLLEEDPLLVEWANHLMWLWNLHELGCVFRMDDLTPEEWRGLMVLRQEMDRKQEEELKRQR